MPLLVLIGQLLLCAFLIAFIIIIGYSLVSGTPYAPLGQERLQKMMDVLEVRPGEKAVDIGSGDGRIVIELAKRGAIAHGYEINPLLVLIAKFNVQKAGLQGKAHIHLGDMFKQDYSSYNIVTFYVTDIVLRKIEKKLLSELRPGARVTTNHYTFPVWKPTKIKKPIYLYIKN